MTLGEFRGGWKTLRGAGLQGAKDAAEDVYFGALQETDARVWGLVVKRAIVDCNFFPSIHTLKEILWAVGKEQRQAEREDDQDAQGYRKALPPLRRDVGDPACPAVHGEPLYGYLERLAFYHGYLPRAGYVQAEEHTMRTPGEDG